MASWTMQNFSGARELLRTLLIGKFFQFSLCVFPSFLICNVLFLFLIDWLSLICLFVADNRQSISRNIGTFWRPRFISSQGSLRLVQTKYRITPTGASMENKEVPADFLRDKKMVPSADPPKVEDINILYQFFDRRYKWGDVNLFKFNIVKRC